MALKPNLPPRVAFDTNVALDFADGREDVVDALATIRRRIKNGTLCVPPTVVLELGHAADFGETSEKRAAARNFLQQHRAWNFRLVHFVPAGEAQVLRIAECLREHALIPDAEVNDSLVLAEAALLGCAMLLTSDEHLRGIDFERLALELQAFDASPPVIATPREIVRKFFR
jgi:predicted nucleic acid-binding protein